MTLSPFGHYVGRVDLAVEAFRKAQRGGTDHLVAQLGDQLCREAETLVAAWRLEHGSVRAQG
jgi:hypothetical protein